jgi:hypothetical protein
MKKKIIFYLFLFLALAGVYSNCAENSNRVYFTINPENRQIIIPVQLNDSITANMTFDTGWNDRAIFLDSTFVAFHSCLLPNTLPETSQIASAWGGDGVSNLIYNTQKTVKIGNTDLTYNGVQIFDWKKALQSNNDGIFNIPTNDTTHVWELNFEHNYLEIHPAESFQMPKNCLLSRLEMNALFGIQLNLQIKSADGDTLTINGEYTIDTGMAWDIALMHPNKEESDFFNKREDAVWTHFMDGYNRYYTVRATIFDNFIVDSLRIYTFNSSHRIKSEYLIGQNFLKRFNVFFDMKNRQVGLQPIKNFQRVVNPNHRRFHLSTNITSDRNLIVTMIADYKDNYYKKAGLQEGDEITAINGKLFKDITYEEKLKFNEIDTFVFDIIRKGQTLKLVIPVDKNEEQGD